MKLNILLLALFLSNISLIFAVKASSNKSILSKRNLKKYLEQNPDHIQKRGGPGGMYRLSLLFCDVKK